MNNYYKIIVAVVAVLIVLNVMLLIFVWKEKQQRVVGPERVEKVERARHEGLARFLEREIGLSKQQKKSFKILAKAHRKKRKEITHEIRNQKLLLNEHVILGDSASIQNRLSKVDSLHHQNELELIQYLKQIAAICTDEQRAQLNEIFKESAGPHQRRPRIR
ncbi:MAG: hypothetical protein KI790_04915 [Cyclobacteriaceae bacterium]|nr:hypothetical protein [Cyclobacteriaceae bacterium HetDA_MAG_MS6]